MQIIISSIVILMLVAGFAEADQTQNYYLDAVKSALMSDDLLAKSAQKLQEHKNVTVIDELEVPPFHKRSVWEQDSLSRTFCTTCHLQPPHRKNIRSRTFLNMHTEYIACETCHLRPEGVSFDYQWLDYRNERVVKAKPELFRQFKDKTELGKNGQRMVRATDKQIKIAPFWQGEKAIILRDHVFSQHTATLWKSNDAEAKVLRRAKIHAPLREKGPDCQACHQQQKPLLDLTALGANEGQQQRIQQHIVPQFFKRYQDDEQRIRINNLLQ